MQILIADDQQVTLSALTQLLQRRGYDTVSVRSGDAAWEVLQREDGPSLALLDHNMPGLTGPEICRLARNGMPNRPLHLILISAQQFSTEAKVMGLGSGADDYITSPFEPAELLARLRVGERMLRLHLELRKKICELQKTSAEVRQLQGLLPICMDCKKIRDDNNYWHQVEHYIRRYADVSFTHSICPACFQKRKAAMSLAKPPPFLDPAPKDEVERVSGVSPVTG